MHNTLGQITLGVVWSPSSTAINHYIGRSTKHPSALGNPWVITTNKSRDAVCDAYATYLPKAIEVNTDIAKELNHIVDLILGGKDVNLTCYCKAPLRCHGLTIKSIIEDALIKAGYTIR